MNFLILNQLKIQRSQKYQDGILGLFGLILPVVKFENFLYRFIGKIGSMVDKN